MLLETRGLTKRYGGLLVLEKIDFNLEEGETHCLIGPNGAGKSTFFKLIVGIERPTAGEIFYQDQRIDRHKPFERARKGLAVKFQDLRVMEHLTVFQNLFLPLRRHYRGSEIQDEAARLVQLVRLPGCENQVVEELSHGQQQWLSIAMSIAGRPDLVLLDEPAAGLGPEETRETADIIRDLKGTGTGVLVIEHDMQFVRDLNMRTTVLHLGRLFAQGSFDEIAANKDVREAYLGTSVNSTEPGDRPQGSTE